jgi:hypothetical protein
MQLSGLLEKLKGLFTPAFLISSVTPLFCFVLVNGAILGRFSEAVDRSVQGYFLLDTAPKTVIAAIVSVALLVVAYVFSTLNLGLREILEGQRLPEWLRAQLCSSETARLDALLMQLRESQKTRFRFQRQAPSWVKKLRVARGAGVKIGTCTYPEDCPAHAALAELEKMRWRGAALTVERLKECVDLLEACLLKSSSEILNNPASRRLDHDHQRMLELIEYARQRVEADYIRLFNERDFNFSRDTVAPTRMGNIAESVRSYAQSRYRMNLVFFWTRLQKVLQEKAEFYKTLQDAKTQLDFTVSLFWLTAVSTAVWVLVLPVLSRTWLPLIAVWAIGPVLMRTWYLVGVQNYRSFADLLRSSLDLFRFELLKELKVALPDDAEAEGALWDRLNRRIGYGEPTAFISYKHE